MPRPCRPPLRWNPLRPLAAVAAAAALAGCGAPANLPEDVLFREASLSFEDEAYNTAIQSYKKLLEEFPFSDKAEIASLNIAYAHYLTGEYSEAIIAFNDFERLYPVSPLLPFISYTIGMCWLDQAKAGDRDPTYSQEALRQFRKVASEYPNTIYGDLARFREKTALENLSAHELYVGDWYRDRKRTAAAESRYRYLLREYPDTENAARARARLDELASARSAAATGDSIKAAAPAEDDMEAAGRKAATEETARKAAADAATTAPAEAPAAAEPATAP